MSAAQKPVSEPTLDQRRAKHAWDAVQKAKTLSEKDQKKFGTQAKKLPSRILTAGLGQALAFLRAKDYSPALLACIDDWVLTERRPTPGQNRTESLLEAILKRDAPFLRWATEETLLYLQWLTRFAEAEGMTKGAED